PTSASAADGGPWPGKAGGLPGGHGRVPEAPPLPCGRPPGPCLRGRRGAAHTRRRGSTRGATAPGVVGRGARRRSARAAPRPRGPRPRPRRRGRGTLRAARAPRRHGPRGRRGTLRGRGAGGAEQRREASVRSGPRCPLWRSPGPGRPSAASSTAARAGWSRSGTAAGRSSPRRAGVLARPEVQRLPAVL
ncbi:unnamed protein product, partial [Prorocentrum cordatum]